MKRYLDISMPIHEAMTVYKNKPEKKPHFVVDDQHHLGKSYETTVTMNVHTGTHLDFPLHMVPQGLSSTDFNPSTLMRSVQVVECLHTRVISLQHVQALSLSKGDFILFKTDNSFIDHFDFQFTYIDASAAAYLANQELAGVGIDALGIERDQDGHPTHSILMQANILILEGLRLKEVRPGTYQMVALPLAMNGLDALPLRVLLEANT